MTPIRGQRVFLPVLTPPNRKFLAEPPPNFKIIQKQANFSKVFKQANGYPPPPERARKWAKFVFFMVFYLLRAAPKIFFGPYLKYPKTA
jgi:hypothetical protein